MPLNTFKTLPLLPREPFIAIVGKDFNGQPIYDISPAWRLYVEQLQQVLGNVSGLDWQVIDKSNASLAELGQRKHAMLQEIQGEGDLHVSQDQVDKWDSLTDNGDDQLLFWIR